MFVKSYTAIPADFEQVSSRLRTCPHGWVDAVAAEVERYGERLLTEVGLQGRSRRRRPARLEVGEAVATERTILLPLRVHVRDATRLMPSLEGNLDAAWLGPGHTYLSLSVQYELAPAVMGEPIDRVLLHRVVEAVALRFVEAAAKRLVSCPV